MARLFGFRFGFRFVPAALLLLLLACASLPKASIAGELMIKSHQQLAPATECIHSLTIACCSSIVVCYSLQTHHGPPFWLVWHNAAATTDTHLALTRMPS